MLGKALGLLLILQCNCDDITITTPPLTDIPHNYGDIQCDPALDFDPKPETSCEMPKEIENGEMVEVMKSVQEKDMVHVAQYKCNEDYMMMETWKGDMGWCRQDGTYELPRCVTRNEWFKVEFELDPGISKMKNAGRVKARYVYADGSKGDWYAGCDDHMNDQAAGAVCRAMGFRYGRQIQPDRRMTPIDNIPFGKTNIYCYHDDTLLTSESCNADDYNQMAQKGWPLCVPDEQATVQCFDDWWKVDVGFDMIERNGKMFCPVQVIKEGNEMNLKTTNVQVKWGGINLKDQGDGYDAEYFEEGVHYEVIGGFSKKKGFRAKFVRNKSEYDCFFCEVHIDGNHMNINSEKNHNCGANFVTSTGVEEIGDGSRDTFEIKRFTINYKKNLFVCQVEIGYLVPPMVEEMEQDYCIIKVEARSENSGATVNLKYRGQFKNVRGLYKYTVNIGTNDKSDCWACKAYGKIRGVPKETDPVKAKNDANCL